MEGIKLLIIIFGLLFIIETKPMNIIFHFIGIIFSVALLLGVYNTEYLSYLLIIIYCSALTIIFGFVIMLSPQITTISKNNFKLIIPLLLFLFYFFSPQLWNSEDINFNIDPVENKEENLILKKIGYLLYLNNTDIIKLIISTFILFLALVALFYILKPTFFEKNKI